LTDTDNRLECLRQYIDEHLLTIPEAFQKRCAYTHLYTVSQNCALLAKRRGQNVELAAMAGMLHDFYTYTTGDASDHAEKGALLARKVLDSLHLTSADETDAICAAIHSHSDKASVHSPFTEILIDADVLSHVLYNPEAPVFPREAARWARLCRELGLDV